MAGNRDGSANPTRSKAKQGYRRPVDQVPGRPHERIGDDSPRWMVVGCRPRRSTDHRIRLTGGLADFEGPPELGGPLVPLDATKGEIRSPRRAGK